MRLTIAILLLGLMASPSFADHRGPGWGRGGGYHHWRPGWGPRWPQPSPDTNILGGILGGLIGGWISGKANQPPPPPQVQNWCIMPDGSRHPC